MNPPPNLGQDHQLYVLVLEHDCSECLVALFQSHLVREWIGIDLAATSLVNTLFQEHRIWVCVLDRVRRNNYLLFPATNSIRLTRFPHQIQTSMLVELLRFTSANSPTGEPRRT